MFLKRKEIIKCTVFIFCSSYSIVSLSKESCHRDLNLEKAKVKVEEYKKLYNVDNYHNYKVSLKPANGECHYYYYETVKDNFHSSMFYYLAEDGAVLYLGRRLAFRPGTIKCPAMKKFDKKYFLI